VIVDIFLFFDFTDNCTAAMPAFDQAGKSEIMGRSAKLAGMTPVHHALDALPYKTPRRTSFAIFIALEVSRRAMIAAPKF